MDYLGMCQRLRSEVGASGNDQTVENATGEWARICNWVGQSWVEIQSLHLDWNFLRASFSFNTIANQAEYPYASAPLSLTNFSRWKDGSFRIYKDTIGDEHRLEFYDYEDFRDTFLISTYPTSYAYPHAITVSPSDSLILSSPPDGIYTVSGEFFDDITELAGDRDVPALPNRYHMLIVYRAMMDYASYESAPEVMQRAELRYREMLFRVESDELPDVTFNRGFL